MGGEKIFGGREYLMVYTTSLRRVRSVRDAADVERDFAVSWTTYVLDTALIWTLVPRTRANLKAGAAPVTLAEARQLAASIGLDKLGPSRHK